MVRTLRCGRSNPGSNPGHGMFCHNTFFLELRTTQVLMITLLMQLLLRSRMTGVSLKSLATVVLGDIAQW